MGGTAEWRLQRIASLEPTRATRTRRRIAAEVVGLVASSAGAIVAWRGELAGADVAWLAMWAVVAGGGWALTAPDGARLGPRRHVAPGAPATSQELHAERRSGWQTLAAVPLGTGVIEHVAFGPGGILAIESAVLELSWEPGTTRVDEPFRHLLGRCRAAGSATAAAVHERSRLPLDVRPVLVVWGSTPARLDAPLEIDGVTIVPGPLLRSYLRSLPDRLGELHQRCARLAVQHVAEQPGRHEPVTHPLLAG